MIRCPVCGERHTVPDKYDNREFTCMNGTSRAGQKTFRELPPEDLFTQNNPMGNSFSTRVNEARPATVLVDGPGYRKDGSRITSRKPYNW